MKYDHFNYSSALINTSRKLRKHATKAEIRIWKSLLCKRKCLGFRFQRQRVIGKYIVDFFCFELKLVIEIDGYIHQKSEVQANDKEREVFLKSLGCQLIRFSNEEICFNLDQVGLQLKTRIAELATQR